MAMEAFRTLMKPLEKLKSLTVTTVHHACTGVPLDFAIGPVLRSQKSEDVQIYEQNRSFDYATQFTRLCFWVDCQVAYSWLGPS